MLQKAGFAVGNIERKTIKAESAAAVAFQKKHVKACMENRIDGVASVEEDLELMRTSTFHGNVRKAYPRGGKPRSNEFLFQQRKGWTAGRGLKRPHLSIDETFGNQNHSSDRTLHDKKNKEKGNRRDGKGKRVCVYAAWETHSQTGPEALRPSSAEMTGSLLHYVQFEAQGGRKNGGKAQLRGPTHAAVKGFLQVMGLAVTGTKVQGVRRVVEAVHRVEEDLSAELRASIAECKAALKVYDAEINPGTETPEDYHGNFNSEKWRAIFRQTCIIVARELGSCIINLDGATYHKLCTNVSPTSTWHREDRCDWIRERQAELGRQLATPEELAPGGLTLPSLMEIVEEVRPAKHYEVFDIAAEYGHDVEFTPPYMHRLAFCEILFGIAKNPIGRRSANSMADLKKKLHDNMHAVTSQSIVRAYADMRQFQNEVFLRDAPVDENGAMPEEESDDDSDGEESDFDFDGAESESD